MPQIKIVPTKEYKDARDAAPEAIRWELEDLETELRRNRLTPGRKPENIHCRSKETLHSYRVNKDWRLITYRWKEGEVMLLLAGKHDDTYRRAQNMRFDWKNGKSSLPVTTWVDTIEVAPSKCVKEAVVRVEEPKPTLPDNAKPFAEYTKEQLLKLGVPKEQVDRVRGATYKELDTDTQLDVEVVLLLIEVAEGTKTYEEAVKEVETRRKRPSAETDLARHPEKKEHYFVLTDEIRDAFLNGELENWQVFLHPSQTEAVETKANGPVLVSGPAGTGKSVVAFHRVKWLLRQKGFEGKRVLFTTYTTTLAQYAQAMLAKLCTEEELERVDVVTFDAFLRDAWTRGGTRRTGRLSYGQDRDGETWLPEALASILEEEDYFEGYLSKWHGRDREFFRREYLNVIQEYDIRDAEAYKNLKRPAIYGNITKRMRGEVWPLFAEMNDSLSQVGRYQSQPRVVALNRLTEALTDSFPNEDKAYLLGRYGAVVVDEVQDFGASEYRFLAALTGNTIDHPRPTLYLTGDGHQRIYGRIGTFSQCNINVTNRSIKLTKCYRSTEAIRKFAESLLKGAEVKGFDGEFETFGGESLEQGEPPVEKYFSNYTAANDAIANTIQAWMAKASKNYGDYAVLLRSNKRKLYAVTKALEERGIPAALVTKEDELDLDDGRVKVMTMYRAKGLQFVGVVLVLDDWPARPKNLDTEDAEAIEEHMLSERQLLYMATMRAQRFVFLTSSNGHSSKI